MNATAVATALYTAFANRDGAAMAALYAPDGVFEDPAFGVLTGAQAGVMWQMLCTRGRDLRLEWQLLQATETTAEVRWVATYTFAATGRKVRNDIVAALRVQDGRIVEHRDVFDFAAWARQALGPVWALPGMVWLSQRLIRAAALRGLRAWRV